MYEDINRRMEASYQGILRSQKLQSMLNDLMRRQEELKEKVDGLKEMLDKEEVDVSKLEGKSLGHVLYSVLGKLDEHLLTERKEALAARLKYDQAVQDLEHINTEIYKLNSEKTLYKSCENEYIELYEKKKELLLQSNSLSADRILALTQQLNTANHYCTEVDEALTAGSEVLQHINNAADSLNSAEGWGTWDMFGGGLLTDMVKHSHIDDAKGEVECVQEALSRFRTELADVRITNSISIDTDGFGKFADFFFDGIIADWCMQSQIHASQESVDQTRQQVEKVMDKLKDMKKEEEARSTQLGKEIDELVTLAI